VPAGVNPDCLEPVPDEIELIKEPVTLWDQHHNLQTRVKQVNVSFFAKVGNGKSSSANTLLTAWGYDGPPFEARRQRGAVTAELQTIEQEFVDREGGGEESEAKESEAEGGIGRDEGLINDDGEDGEASEERKPVILRVTDQPGLMDASGHVADAEHLRGTALSGEHQDGYHVLFVVEKITDRLDATEQIILRALKKFYGDAVCPHIVLLLTHSDVLDDQEEIERMIGEARADVEKELGAPIANALAVNNHPCKSDEAGLDRAMSGRHMIKAIHDVVVKMHEPFKPPEVELDAVIWYVDQEVERNPSVEKDNVLAAILRFIPVIGKKNLCTVM